MGQLGNIPHNIISSNVLAHGKCHIGFVVYKAKLSDIHIFIGDCEGLDEYYLVTEDFMELYSITDHDDLLYIDVRKNEMRIDNKPG